MSRTNAAAKLARAPHKATRKIVAHYGEDLPKALYTEFARANRAHFGGKLGSPMILVQQAGGPRALGDYIGRDIHGLESCIRIAPSNERRGLKFCFDVLLHEMVHAWQTEVSHEEESGYRGHGPRFAEQCNLIGKKLGLPPVGVRNRGDNLPDCAHWPMNVRPAGYYPAPWIATKHAAKSEGKTGGTGGGESERSEPKADDRFGIIVDGSRVAQGLNTLVTLIASRLGVRRSDVLARGIVALMREMNVKQSDVAEHVNVRVKRTPALPPKLDDILGKDPSPVGTANDSGHEP